MSDKPNPTPDAVEHLVTVNMAEFSSGTREFVKAILAVAEGVFGKGSAKTLAGSGSVSVEAKVIAKVVPRTTGKVEHVIIGVSSDYCPETWAGLPTAFDGPLLVIDSPFHFYLLPADRREAEDTAGRVFRDLKTRLPAGD